MPAAEFFARMGPEFAEHCGFARKTAARQADAARLLAKVEYEFHLVRRELATVMPGIVVTEPDAAHAKPADTSAISSPRSAKAA
jgi:hypothetical protein